MFTLKGETYNKIKKNITMEEKELIHTQHYTNSVVEVYLDREEQKVYQIKCLRGDKCSTYEFSLDEYVNDELIGYENI
tara:strand:+ start:1749 stop:1982 length:234 start_codon:yes stop_codon:yes gene_type:complete